MAFFKTKKPGFFSFASFSSENTNVVVREAKSEGHADLNIFFLAASVAEVFRVLKWL